MLFTDNIIATTHIRDGHDGWEIAGTGADTRLTITASEFPVQPSTEYQFTVYYWSSDGNVDDIYIQFDDTGWPESSYYLKPFVHTAKSTFTIEDLGSNLKKCTAYFITNAATTKVQSIFFDVDVSGVSAFMSIPLFVTNSVDPGEYITKATFDEVKTSIDGALTKTGQTFTWTEMPVTQGDKITLEDVTELRTALDLAFDNLVLANDCPSNNSTNNGNDSYRSGKDNSVDVNDTADDSFCANNTSREGFQCVN